MAHPYAASALALPGKAKGKGNAAGDWDCPNCGDRNFSTRVQCRKCSTVNPTAPMPDVNDMGFKTVMCSFHQAGRCTKGAYCSFAHGEEELTLGRQMMESKVDAMPAPELHEFPIHVQQFLAGLVIKPLPLKQFLTMEHAQRELVIQQGPLHDARDATAMLISRMVKIRKMANLQAKIASGQIVPQAMNAYAPAAGPPPTGTEFTVTFQPGPIGVGANWATGRVDKVVDGGQGIGLGLQIGDWFTQINGVPYTEQLLDAARAFAQPFTVTLLRPQEYGVPGAALGAPQELGQFAANLGMDWAVGGGFGQ